MNFTKFRKEILFYILQILGWYGYHSTAFIIPDVSLTYKWFNFITGGLVLIIATSIYRVYLKNNVDFEMFGKKSVYKLFFAFLACSGLVYSLSSLSDLVYERIWSYTAAELLWIEKSTSFMLMVFDLTIIILLWTIVYFVVKFIIEANKNHLLQLELSATLREAQLNSLKGQVNPHFLFNSINNIRGLMLEDVGKSQEMITKLSEMLDYAFAKNSVDAIPLHEELEMVENYIALSKIQMEDRLTFEKDIAEETLPISIPPMIIQLLIENAAKHGIANLKAGGVIKLTTEKQADELTIIVSNTGKLSIAKDSTQLGLKNIRQRLHLLYGAKAFFSLEEVQDEVVATIKIPLT